VGLTLKQRAMTAGSWSILGYGVSIVLRFASTLVMTRLLAPEMFGIMAIAGMVTMILSLLSDIGLSQHIVQSPRGDDPSFLDTVWVVQIIRGIILWLASLLLSLGLYYMGHHGMLLAESVYAAEALPTVIAVSSLVAVIAGFQSTRMPSAHRGFDQKRLTQIDLVGQVAGLVVMIAIGIQTGSIWALVAGALVVALTKTTLSHYWMSGHPNRFRLERHALSELVGFGKWVFVSSAVGVLAVNGDRLLLGALVDPYVLGLYSIALLIVGAIEGGLSRLFMTVSLPVLSEIYRGDPSRLREIYYKLRLPGDLLLLFMAGLLFASGQIIVDLLYDARYSAAGSMLQVLALSLFAVRYGIANQLYLAVGKPRYLAIINVVRIVSLYALIPTLFHIGGIHAATWGIALHAMLTIPFVHYFNASLNLNDWWREAMVLPALPFGYLCGFVLNQAMR